MFTGIVESVGRIQEVRREAGSLRLRIASPLAAHLHVGQSVMHDGVCLTVEQHGDGWHEVVAVAETLRRTRLGLKGSGDYVNLERAVTAQSLLDGHLVQGHVDAVARCLRISEEQGSWRFTFGIPRKKYAPLLVAKGSVCINGVSLTVATCSAKKFSVAIIPYTYSHTTFQYLSEGEMVNVEFDIIGKYVQRMVSIYLKQNKK